MLLCSLLVASCGCRSGIGVNKIRTTGSAKWQNICLIAQNAPANVVGFSWKVVGIKTIGQLAFHILRLSRGFSSSLSFLSLSSFCSYYFFFFCWRNSCPKISWPTNIETYIYDALLLYLTQSNYFFFLKWLSCSNQSFTSTNTCAFISLWWMCSHPWPSPTWKIAMQIVAVN